MVDRPPLFAPSQPQVFHFGADTAAELLNWTKPAPEPYEKQRLVMCPCCSSWLMKGSLGPKGCPTCGGCL